MHVDLSPVAALFPPRAIAISPVANELAPMHIEYFASPSGSVGMRPATTERPAAKQHSPSAKDEKPNAHAPIDLELGL